MSEFLAGLAGVLIGGALSLIGVRWTLDKQDERDRKDDERRLRDRKHDRLREAYRDVVAVAYHTPRQALILVIEAELARDKGRWEEFTATLREPGLNTSDARATLLLEAADDRAVLDRLTAITIDDLGFRSSLVASLKEGLSADEIKTRSEEMQAKAEELASLARERLANLEHPIA